MRYSIPKVHNTIKRSFIFIDKDGLKASPPIRIETADNVQEQLGLQVGQLSQPPLYVRLNTTVRLIPHIFENEFDYCLLKEAGHENA